MSYEQLRDRARGGDTKLCGYLSWLCGAYGPAGIRQIQMYGPCRSQGFDAAAWLKRQCWDVCEAGKITDPSRGSLLVQSRNPEQQRRRRKVRQKARMMDGCNDRLGWLAMDGTLLVF